MGPAFHIGLLPGRPAAEVTELIVAAEEEGFAGAWIADSQSIFRDAFAVLALAAARTERIELATGVTNPLTRHPAVLAGSFATLDELAGGRVTLGIGVGESAVNTIGLRPARLARLAEVASTVRALARGERATWEGHELHLPWASRELTVVFAASGPRSLALAGATADGALFQVGALPALVTAAIARVRAGATQTGRRPDAVRLLCRLACSVSPDRTWAREQVRGYAAAAAGTVLASVAAGALPDDVAEDIRRMKERYDYMEHASAEARHGTLVTERIVDAISISGTPEEAVPRFQALVDAGVEEFVIPVTSEDPVASMRVLARDVVPYLRARETP